MPRALGEVDMVKALPAPLGLQKAPLPGISNPLRMSAPSSLGPLGGSNSSIGGIGGSDPLGSLGKGTSLLRKADPDMKVSSSLEGPRLGSLVSSRDPSPLNSNKFISAPIGSVAEQKVKTTDVKQMVEQKSGEEESVRVRERESESDVERRMGRLDVTAGLNKPRSQGAASKLRSALPSANSPTDRNNDDDWQNSPSEEKQSESGRYSDHKATRNDDKSEEEPESRGAAVRNEIRGSVSNSPSPTYFFDRDQAVSSSNSAAPGALAAAERDVAFYKNKCTDMERRVEEYEVRVADYKTSYNNAKEDLLAMERRYESNQSQWMDRLRAVEVEKDKVEGERRQLKLTLIDLEATAAAAGKPSQVAVSNSSMSSQNIDEATKLENDRLAREVETLKRQVHTAEANLTRSTAAHLELQQRLLAAEADAQRRIATLEEQHIVAVAERAELLTKLEANKHNDSVSTSVSLSAESNVMYTLQEEKANSAKKDAEIARLRNLLVEEQARSASALDVMRTEMATAADAATALASCRSQESDVKLTELQNLLSDLQAKVTSLSTQLQRESAENALLKSRAQTAESTVTVLEATVAELRSQETILKRDIADRDRKLSDQQEQALALAASANLSTNVDNERSAQFEVFVSQATAIRKSLKAEIERQKTQLSELESEKSALVTQLTRQETTLQFAKKELNAVADLKEATRQLESEKQQLVLQLEATRATLARQAEQEFQLSERREKELQARVQSEALCSALRQENDRLALTLEQERTAAVQSEKKIKSYQEELLQLQRRLAERAPSPQKIARSTTEPTTTVSAFSPAASPLPFVVDTAADSPARLDHQLQLAAKQRELDQATQALAASAAQLVESDKQLRLQQHAADMLSGQVADLQDQLRTVTGQLSEARAKNVDRSENLSATFQKEKELFDVEKLNLSGQIKVLQSQLSSAQENFEHISASAKRLEAEVSTYREKWLSSEKDLTDARLQLSASTVGADLTTSTLRIELREALAGVQHGKAVEEALRAQMVDLRKSLEDRDATIRDLRAEALLASSLPRDEKDKENVQQQSRTVVPASTPTVDSQQAYCDSKEHHLQQQHVSNNSSSSTQHIVALSLEVGRQQATMERLEQHIRNTDIVLQEIKTQGSSRIVTEAKKSSAPASPVAARKDATRRAERQQQHSDQRDQDEAEEPGSGWGSSTPESQQSLLVVNRVGGGGTSRAAGIGDFSSSPARKARNRQKTARLVQFKVPSQNKDRRNTVTASPFVDLIELVDIKDRIASLVEDMDMDVHDCTTLSASMGRGEHIERIVQSTAQRVLIEGKARVKQETKFFKEVQAICLAAKDSINHNQDCVKNLKAAWRNAKSEAGGGNDGSGGGISTESVNSVTLKVNSSVDELREVQQMIKAREIRMKSLLHSVQYLEQLVNRNDHAADSDDNSQQQHLEHLMEIMRLVQEKCVASAADLEALVQSYRSKGTQGGGRAAAAETSSSKQPLQKHQPQQHRHQQEYAPSQNSTVSNIGARGVAFTTHEKPMTVPAETFMDNYSAPVPPPSGHGHGHAAMDGFYYRTAPEPHRQPSFASLPMPVFSSSVGSAAPSAVVAVSAAVSSMRNSELKNRLLHEQIAKITERQSLSKAAYDKHAG